MGDETICTLCEHPRDAHDICHFDHNECLCGCREFRTPAPMSDMVSVPAEKIAALRDELSHHEPSNVTCECIYAARAVVDAVETEDEPQGIIRHPADENGPYEAHYDHVICDRCTRAPARDDAETFEDELDDHIAESMKDPEYANADRLYREAETSWQDWVPSMFADDENMHTAYVSGYKDARAAPDELTALRERVAELERDCADLKELAEASGMVESRAIVRAVARERERDALRERIRKIANDLEADNGIHIRTNATIDLLRAALGDA